MFRRKILAKETIDENVSSTLKRWEGIEFLVASRQEVPLLCTISVFYYHGLWCANHQRWIQRMLYRGFWVSIPKNELCTTTKHKSRYLSWIRVSLSSMQKIDSGPQIILGAELFISMETKNLSWHLSLRGKFDMVCLRVSLPLAYFSKHHYRQIRDQKDPLSY